VEQEETMYARIWKGTSLALVLAATAGLAAQGGTSELSLIGCIRKADPPPAAGSPGEFVVSDVASVSLPRNYPEGSITRTYKLDVEAAKVSPHVGHKVTIAGTLAVPPSGQKPATPVDKPTPPPNPANAPVLKVTTLTMLAATCP
jgi:hypothetical protein